MKPTFTADDLMGNWKNNRSTLPLDKLSKSVRVLFETYCNYPVIPPANGKNYSTFPVRFNMEGELISLTEKAVNLANLISQGKPPIQAVIGAGYAWTTYFSSEFAKGSDIKISMDDFYKRLVTPKVLRIANYLKKDTLEEIRIDATWLLTEQVNLFTLAKANGQLTVAARVLNDIASHVDVDAKVTSKLELTDNIDYASLLANAKQRKLPQPPEKLKGEPPVLEVVPTKESNG